MSETNRSQPSSRYRTNVPVPPFPGTPTTLRPASSRAVLNPSQLLVFWPATWEPCRCDQQYQMGERCHARTGLCTQTMRDCRAYPCKPTSNSSLQGGSDTTMEIIRPSRRPPRTRISQITKPSSVTTTSNHKNVTTSRESVTPETTRAETSVVLGAVLGGVTLVAVVCIIILLCMCRKIKRNDKEGKKYCPMCKCCERKNPAMGNPTYMAPEMTHYNSPETNPSVPEAASVRSNATSHFYETIHPVRPQSRTPGYDQLGLPRVIPVSGTPSSERSPIGHEYLELETSYDELATPRLPNRVQYHRMNLSDTMTSDSARRNGYDVIGVDDNSGIPSIDKHGMDDSHASNSHGLNTIDNGNLRTAPSNVDSLNQPYASLEPSQHRLQPW